MFNVNPFQGGNHGLVAPERLGPTNLSHKTNQFEDCNDEDADDQGKKNMVIRGMLKIIPMQLVSK